MRVPHLAVAALALALTGPALAAPSPAQLANKAPAKSHPAAAARTVTLDLTGLD